LFAILHAQLLVLLDFVAILDHLTRMVLHGDLNIRKFVQILVPADVIFGLGGFSLLELIVAILGG